MRSKFQSKQSIRINASIESVWEYNQDLTKIPEFHPRVTKVDLVSEDRYRKKGAIYKCYIKNGKHYCIEKDIVLEPMYKIVTSLPEDTMGLSNILKDYTVETFFKKIDKETTEMEFNHYYATPGFFRYLLNFLIKLKIAQESNRTLEGIKNAIEKSYR